MQIKVIDIVWDTDGVNPHDCGLPTEVTLDAKEVFGLDIQKLNALDAMTGNIPLDPDDVVNYLSDEYEYYIQNCNVSFIL